MRDLQELIRVNNLATANAGIGLEFNGNHWDMVEGQPYNKRQWDMEGQDAQDSTDLDVALAIISLHSQVQSWMTGTKHGPEPMDQPEPEPTYQGPRQSDWSWVCVVD